MSELLNYLVENEPSFRRARLPALYSDFRSQRTLNPDGYQANVSAWRRALTAGLRAGLMPSRSSATTSSSASSSITPDVLVLTVDEPLLRALESKQYGRPLALGAVVRDAVADGDLVALPQFLAAKESIYRTPGWSDLPWTLTAWTLRQVGLTGGGGAEPTGQKAQQFVVVANIEVAARTFAERRSHLTSRVERTFSRAQFRREFADVLLAAGGREKDGPRLSETDTDVLLKFLSRDKGLVLYDGRTVRVKAPDEPGVAVLTEEDASIAALRELLERLAHQTDVLERRVDELSAAAREAVARKNRVAALAALRSKRLAEASLEKRFATRGQLEEVAARIEQAADQVALVKVMDSSAEVLRKLNAQVGGVERVEGVVDRLREQMGQVDEVGTILAEPGSQAVLDEGEIDDELAAMEKEERAKEAEAERKRVEAEQARQAEETRRRLDQLERLRPIQESKDSSSAEKEPQKEPQRESQGGVAETTEGIRKMSLGEPAAQVAS